jgi:hypothetical protein
MLFTFATAGVLTAGLSALAGREKALLAGIVLLGTASFIKLGAAEYADVPIAFFFLASIVQLCMLDRLPMSGAVLLGISAAFAAWTKNEGLLLFVVLLITLKWTRQPPSRVLMGAFCVLTLLAIFKLSLAPPNDLVQNLRTVLLRNVTDPSRYLSVVTGFIYELINFGSKRFNPLVPLFAALLLLKKDAKYGARSAVIILWGVITGIYFVYLVAPVDVAWQIAWSLDRVLLQLWPATLFTCFYIIDFPTAPRTAITRQSLHLSPPLASRRVP